MTWYLICTDKNCEYHTKWLNAGNIVDLLDNHIDKNDSNGWFRCRCGKRGYIKRKFDLQEKSKSWEPLFVGAVNLVPSGEEAKYESYRPFAFFVSYYDDEASEHKKPKKFTEIIITYYKDLRKEKNGRLKMGYGPGGPAVIDKENVFILLSKLVENEYFNTKDKDRIKNIMS